MIIKSSKHDLLCMAGIIEFAMLLFYINASTIREFLTEFGISLLVIFFIVFREGETIVLDAEGCCVQRLHGLVRKKYKWEQLKTKRILYKSDQRKSLGYEVKKCVLLSPRKIKIKSVWNNPFVLGEFYTTVEKGTEFINTLPFIFQPLNIIYIDFANEKTECEKDGSYCVRVDESVFMAKMAEWHIELDEEKEEIPPWKEFL